MWWFATYGPTSALDQVTLCGRVWQSEYGAFILELNPDLVHVFSLFEGSRDNTVTSVGHLSADYPVTVTLYDLIPLTPCPVSRYRPSVCPVVPREGWASQEADGLLTISAFSAAEAAEQLGYDADRVRIGHWAD